MVGMDRWLDQAVLEGFSNLDDSMITGYKEKNRFHLLLKIEQLTETTVILLPWKTKQLTLKFLYKHINGTLNTLMLLTCSFLFFILQGSVN